MKTARGKTKTRRSKSVQPGEILPDCTDALERDCTESSIDKSVQPAIAEVKIQDFRAKLKAFLEGDSVLLLGSRWHLRGIVIPVRRSWYRTELDKQTHFKQLRAQFEKALQHLDY